MTSPSQLTVVTIRYNSLDGLRATLASVEAQSYGEIHHLLIDGASTDGSAEHVLQLGSQPHVTAISEPDDGIYHAMNKALDHITGGYLMFLHAGDSFVDDHAVERAMTLITSAARPPDLAIGWSRFVSNGTALPFVVGGVTPNALTSAHESTIFSHDFHQHERYDTSYALAADYLFFRRLFERDDLTVVRMPFTLSNFAFGGRSNNPAYDRPRFLERARINEEFGEPVTALTHVRMTARMLVRRVVYGVSGDHRAALFFLKLACRRGNSGARPLPIGENQVSPG